MNNEELQQLIYAAIRKERKAQTKLINFFWQDIFSFIVSKVHNQITADELTVAVFSKILARLELYDVNFQFKTWMLTIAQNTMIDYWRKEKRNIEELVDRPIEDFKYEKSPEELLISAQEQQNIVNMVQSMEAGYRKIIELRFFDEKSVKEIAEELNISVSNAKVRIMRAKKILQQLLSDDND